MSTDTPQHDANAPTVQDRLSALEFVVGQLALAVESECAALRARLAPGAASAAHEDDEGEPFTVDGFTNWLDFCVQRMEAHRSASSSLRAAIRQAARGIASREVARC